MSKCVVCDGTGVTDDTAPAKDLNMDWWENHQEELKRNYHGKHVAIHGEDGVVASHESLVELDKILKEKGLHETSLCMYIPPVEEPMIKSLHFPDEKGNLSAAISHSAVPILAQHFIELFEKGGGVNYLEMKMSHKDRPDFGEIVVTVQKSKGYSAGEKASTYRDIVRNVVVNLNCDKKAHESGAACLVCVATDALTKYEGKV